MAEWVSEDDKDVEGLLQEVLNLKQNLADRLRAEKEAFDIDSFIESVTNNMDEETARDFRAMVLLHVELGSNAEEPNEIIGISDEALVSYLAFAWAACTQTIDALPPGALDQKMLFRTAMLMGIATGVRLEEMRRG